MKQDPLITYSITSPAALTSPLISASALKTYGLSPPVRGRRSPPAPPTTPRRAYERSMPASSPGLSPAPNPMSKVRSSRRTTGGENAPVKHEA